MSPTSAWVWQGAARRISALPYQGSRLCNLKANLIYLLGRAWSPWEEMLLKSISWLGDTNSMLSGKANLSSERVLSFIFTIAVGKRVKSPEPW